MKVSEVSSTSIPRRRIMPFAAMARFARSLMCFSIQLEPYVHLTHMISEEIHAAGLAHHLKDTWTVQHSYT